MNGNNIALARQWLKKAHNDIITGKQTLLLTEGPTDTVCFHSQQAIEKSLKALLTANNQEVQRTHYLLILLDLSLIFLQELQKYREKLAIITNYAVEIRYPGDDFEPTRKEAIDAIEIAEEIYNIIDNKLNKTQDKAKM